MRLYVYVDVPGDSLGPTLRGQGGFVFLREAGRKKNKIKSGLRRGLIIGIGTDRQVEQTRKLERGAARRLKHQSGRRQLFL